jgi:hypothetical protein
VVCQPLAINPPKGPRAAARIDVHALRVELGGERDHLGLVDRDGP